MGLTIQEGWLKTVICVFRLTQFRPGPGRAPAWLAPEASLFAANPFPT
jgi:hypothetical protein